ncbi:hypothetical protein PIB30_097455 [Stylosanthes scabra]|uniref:Uncharacterized protein n=1 Tax=Stylosanthes scabra TaxID=79078 RepID=A0ABU6XXY8_9FABA|nr:hypothetical protein [Stylosanthes scabra]
MSSLMRAAMIKRSFATSTIPKLKVGGGSSHGSGNNSGHSSSKLDSVPIYMIWGFVGLAVTFACHTGFQQLARSPTVHVNKHRRETMPEVSDPDRTINCADKFINGSFLRKVAHIQDNKTTLNDTSRPNPLTAPRNAETLKTVGVDPTLR